MKVFELTGAELDYWVAKAEEMEISRTDDGPVAFIGQGRVFEPSTRWDHGGPIIEREGIAVYPDQLARHTGAEPWLAGFDLRAERGTVYSEHTEDGLSIELDHGQSGPSPLIAAMRALVLSKFGEDLPAVGEAPVDGL